MPRRKKQSNSQLQTSVPVAHQCLAYKLWIEQVYTEKKELFFHLSFFPLWKLLYEILNLNPTPNMTYVYTPVKNSVYLPQITKYYLEIELSILIYKYLERKNFHKTKDKKVSFLADT